MARRRVVVVLLALALAAGLSYGAVDTVSVTGSVVLPSGATATGGTVSCSLGNAATAPDGGSTVQIGLAAATGTINGSGVVSLTLIPTSIMTPSGSRYSCKFTVSGPVRASWTKSACSVDASPDPLQIGAMSCELAAAAPPAVPGAAGTIVESSGSGTLQSTGIVHKSVAPAAGGRAINGVDLDGDSTPDLFLEPHLGVGTQDATSWLDRVAIFTTIHDIHDETGDGTSTTEVNQRTSLIDNCNTNKATCSAALMKNPDVAGLGWSSTRIADALSKGISLGTHTSDHCFIGMGDAEFSSGYKSSELGAAYDTRGYQTNGLLLFTAGTATVNCKAGSGCVFVPYCYSEANPTHDFDGDGTSNKKYRYSPKSASIAIDTDNDGAVEWNGDDFESIVTTVDGDGTNNRLILRDNTPGSVSCDAVTAGCKYELRTGWYQWARALRGSSDYIDSLAGGAHRTRWYSGPGNEGSSDGIAAILASQGIEGYGGVAMWGAGAMRLDVLQNTAGLMAYRVGVNCKLTEAQVNDMVDVTVRAGGVLAFGGHTPQQLNQGVCTSTDVYDLDTFNAYLARIKYWQQRGRAILVSPDVAVRLASIKQGAMDGRNMVANNSFSTKTTNLNTMYATDYWPWTGTATAANLDYDGTWGGLTITGGGTTQNIVQTMRLRQGSYQLAGFLSATSTTAGVQLCLGAPGTSSAGLTAMGPSFWWVEHEGRNVQSSNLCSPLVTKSSGTKERYVWSQFRVPPELDGVVATVYLQWSGTGTMKAKGITLVKTVPAADQSKHAGFFGRSMKFFSGIAQDTQGYQDYDSAFQYYWAPPTAGLSATPVLDALNYKAQMPNAGNFSVFAVGKASANSSSSAWIAEGAPTLRLGFSGTNGNGYRSRIMLGDEYAFSSTRTSLIMQGTMNRAAQFIATHSGGTEPTFGFFPSTGSTSNAFASRYFALYDEEPGTGNVVFLQHGDDTISMAAGLRLGSTSTTAAEGMCVRRKADCNGATECVFFDMDCDATVDAEDFCMHTDAIDADC